MGQKPGVATAPSAGEDRACLRLKPAQRVLESRTEGRETVDDSFKHLDLTLPEAILPYSSIYNCATQEVTLPPNLTDLGVSLLLATRRVLIYFLLLHFSVFICKVGTRLFREESCKLVYKRVCKL